MVENLCNAKIKYITDIYKLCLPAMEFFIVFIVLGPPEQNGLANVNVGTLLKQAWHC